MVTAANNLRLSLADNPVPQDVPNEPPLPKILVVDDKPENLFTLAHVLAPLEAHVLTAGSGREALRLMLQHRFAVVLLDVQMPGMDGFETAALLREHPETRDVPVIFVTAISKEQRYIKSGYAAGAVDYLLKPIDPEILLGKVRVFLDLEARRVELQRALGTLKRVNHRHKLILNCADEGILGIDLSGNIVFSNPASERLLRANQHSLCGLNIRELFHDSERKVDHACNVIESLSHEGHYRAEDVELRRLDGAGIPVDFSCAAIIDRDHDYSGGVLIFNDITHRKHVEQQLLRLARYDELTGLANRTLFREFMRKSMARAKRANTNMGLLFLDLDRFKAVNDRLGHTAGDQLLKNVGERLISAVRAGDLVARLGGDEFAVVLDGIESPDNAGSVAEKILAELARPHAIAKERVTTHTSIGIVVYSGDNESLDGLIKNADTAMYEAKRLGRNRYRFFSPDMNRHASTRSFLETELAVAIHHNALTVHYQPQLRAADGALSGFEALARWEHPQRGTIRPDEFIVIAEECGLIPLLGAMIARQACGQLAAWQRAGLVERSCRMAINVSMLQLHSGNLVAMIQDCLKDFDLAGENLEIELTESAVMDDTSAAIEQLGELSDCGVRIAIDDFGTGYSSLAYLQRLPLDTLKIDRSFIHGIGDNAGNEAIVTSILALSKSLHLNVVAEGVETAAELDFLVEHGCDYVQGYLLGKPEPPQVIEEALTSRRQASAKA